MKTHEIAQILNEISLTLSSASEEETAKKTANLQRANAAADAAKVFLASSNMDICDAKVLKRTDDIAISLKALASLSRYNKQQWVSIIQEFDLPITLNPRASSRDVLGKVLAYLEANPEVLKAKKKSTTKQSKHNLEDTLTKLINYKP